jgi:alkylhydroperoxidase family enzyme
LARRIGYTEDEIAALDGVEESDLFDPAVRTALVYAERMTRDAHTVTDELFARMREHFSETQILELTCVASMANYFNRLTTALQIDLSGSNTPYEEAKNPDLEEGP